MINTATKQKKHCSGEMLSVVIPQNAENLQLPSPELLNFYNNLEDRTLWVDDEITEYSLEYARYIMKWNKEDKDNNVPVDQRKPIKLLFFSPGGSLIVNNLLVDTIMMSTTKVIGINAGMAASSGCFIFLACHERYSFPTAEFLIHKGAGEFGGDYNSVISAIMNYQREIENLGKYVLERTNIDEETFAEHFDTEWYLSAEEALEYGVCHKIVSSLDEIL